MTTELDQLAGFAAEVDATTKPPELTPEGQPVPVLDFGTEARQAVDMFAGLVTGYAPATADLWHADAKARVSATLAPELPKLQRLLLLFNVEITNGRFPFEKHVGAVWSLEHIHAQNAQDLTRAEQWATWLREHRQALQSIETEDRKASIDELLAAIDEATPKLHAPRFGQEHFNALAAEIWVALNDGLVEGADHSIANLALLSHGANAALGNAVFEVKRSKVLAMDKAGDYIPTATRNVFLKYNTDAGRLQPHFWGEADKTAYLREIKEKLASYLQ